VGEKGKNGFDVGTFVRVLCGDDTDLLTAKRLVIADCDFHG
jgi:hypothetical protein